MDSKKRKPSKDVVVNMAPQGDGLGQDLPAPPTNITETAAFQNSRRSAAKFWGNYKRTLTDAFSRMDRYRQEMLVNRMCQIITIGVTGVALLLFYSLIHRTVRVFLVPGAIFAAWWAANKVVTPVILDRLSSILNKE